LAEVIKQRNDRLARELLNQHANVNEPLPDGTTALHWAVHWGDLELTEWLLAAKASVNAADDYGVTPLWLAAQNGSATIVNKLLRAGADANRELPTGETVLMAAAKTGDAEVVRMLLERGAVVDAREPTLGQTALMWAAAEGHSEAVNALIQHGANIHERSIAGYTPVLFSARNSEPETTRVLLSAGANVNDAARDGTTALMIATIRSSAALAKLLLERGAEVDAGPGFTPLHWAAGGGNVLADGGVTGRMGLQDEGSEWSILEGLEGSEKIEFMKVLLAHGADPNARSTSNPTAGGGRGRSMAGATPFWMAARGGDVEAMRLLVGAGADPSLATEMNTTPLMAAAGVGGGTGNHSVPQAKALQAVTLCLELGDDINAVNKDGETALHGAAYRGPQGTELLIQFLVDHGAKINVKNKHGWTPLIIVEGLYFTATNTASETGTSLLRRLGAEPSPPGLDRQVGTTLRVNP
jgi:ankyrin repeat protein